MSQRERSREVGQRSWKRLESEPGFFSIEIKDKEKCMIAVIRDNREGRQTMTRGLSRGSS